MPLATQRPDATITGLFEALVAQSVEQLTLNQRVQGSSPCGGTFKTHKPWFSRVFFCSDMTLEGQVIVKTRSTLGIIALVAQSFLVGCQKAPTFSETESSNLKPLAVMYGRFIGANRGRGPKDEKELKEFIKARSQEELSNLGISDIDSLFVSSRDKKPYKLKFESKPSVPGQSSNIFAWEQDGIGGKRFVAGTLGEILEVDQAKFQQLVPNP